MQEQEKLNTLTMQILDDCRLFGVEESYIDCIQKDILITRASNDDYYFYYDADKGYVLTFWERGQCNWGISSRNALGFRFLFQRHIIFHDFQSVPASEKFMSCAFPIFGETQEFQDAALYLNRKKAAAAMAKGGSQ